MTTTVTESTKKIASNEVVSVNLIPYMRSVKVYFKATGLRPNTRHFPFFDGVLVSDWCREETFTRVSEDPTEYGSEYNNATEHPETSSNLISDAQGTIEGSFFVPNTDALKFSTGTKEFKLLDISEDNEDEAISMAFHNFESKGQLKKIRDAYLTTRTTTTVIKNIVYSGSGSTTTTTKTTYDSEDDGERYVTVRYDDTERKSDLGGKGWGPDGPQRTPATHPGQGNVSNWERWKR